MRISVKRDVKSIVKRSSSQPIESREKFQVCASPMYDGKGLTTGAIISSKLLEISSVEQLQRRWVDLGCEICG